MCFAFFFLFISPILHHIFTKSSGRLVKGPYLKHNEQSVDITPSRTWSGTNVDQHRQETKSEIMASNVNPSERGTPMNNIFVRKPQEWAADSRICLTWGDHSDTFFFFIFFWVCLHKMVLHTAMHLPSFSTFFWGLQLFFYKFSYRSRVQSRKREPPRVYCDRGFFSHSI